MKNKQNMTKLQEKQDTSANWKPDIQLTEAEQKQYDSIIRMWKGDLGDKESQLLMETIRLKIAEQMVERQKLLIKEIQNAKNI